MRKPTSEQILSQAKLYGETLSQIETERSRKNGNTPRLDRKAEQLANWFARYKIDVSTERKLKAVIREHTPSSPPYSSSATPASTSNCCNSRKNPVRRSARKRAPLGASPNR